MTIERWTDDKLDQLATSVAELRTSVTETRVTAEALLQTVLIHQNNFETLVAEIRDIKTEIRGLQTENRRILDHLFGEENNNE